jgi:hypothetical protein
MVALRCCSAVISRWNRGGLYTEDDQELAAQILL